MKMIVHPDLGEIPAHWEVAELGEVSDITKLAGYEFTKHIEYIEDGEIIALRSLNVVDGQLDLSNIKRISKTVSEVLPRSKLFLNDLLLTYTGSKLGDTALINSNDKYHLAPNVCRLRANQDEDAYFLYVYLRSKVFSKLLDNYKVGSGQPTVPMKNIRRIPLPWPPKQERVNIGLIFSSLTEKIELNRQTSQTLEEMAQTIFKSWFVDFEPTRAKIAAKQNGQDPESAAIAAISGKTLAELDQLSSEQHESLKTTAELFPDTLINSEMEEIPAGWEVKVLEDITSAIIDHRGKTPKKLGGDWVEQGYPAVSAKNIKSGKITRRDTIRFLNDELYAKWMKVELEKGDILLTSEAPMGEMYFITDETKYCLSQRLYALRADNKHITPSFLYLWLQTPLAKADLEGRATGTTVVGIRQSELRKVNCLVPSYDLLNVFEKNVFSMFEQISGNELESIGLSNLRDSLLPKLLSGFFEKVG